MIEAPREAIEFARMVTRAFYPDEYIVLLDAVLRTNSNYCPHFMLAQRLGIPPKELRQMLNRMVQARLMKCDKRQQKKFQISDDRRTSRLITTEFWYVPLGIIVDAFVFRVHKLNEEIEKRKATEREQHKLICARCHSQYQLLDILGWTNHDNGKIICEKIGVRADRRPYPCGGLIAEQDNSKHVKETERMKQMLDVELRPLRERAAICSNLNIPNHPLEEADEKTWEEFAPQAIGPNGERVDEDGIPLESKEQNRHADHSNPNNASKQTNMHSSIQNDDVIPEKPTWFKDSQPEDADDDWDQEQNVSQHNKNKNSSINADEEKAYLERYLKEIGGLPSNSQPTQGKNNSKSPDIIDRQHDNGQNQAQANQQTKNNDNETVPDKKEDEVDDITILVAGKAVKLSQVTEDMHERMTDEEYRTFADALKNANGGDDGDDDDDDMD